MVNISSYSLPQFTDLVNRSRTKGLEDLPMVMKNSGIVNNDTMPMHTGEYRRYAERLTRSLYASVRDEGAPADQGLVQYGYENDMQVYTVAMGISITERMRSAGKNQEILDKVTDLARVCPETMELDLANRLTFAWDTAYTNRDGDSVPTTVGDGFALIYTAHTLTGSATTYSNQITGNPQFSKGALENGEKLFAEETYNNLGEKVAMKADRIITTDDPNTCNQVKELLRATADVTSSNAGTFNVYENKYKHVIVPLLATTATGQVNTAKRKYWFLASSDNSDFYLCTLRSPYLKTPADGNNGEEFSSENWNYLTAATYGMTIVTGRWIKGSKGDGS